MRRFHLLIFILLGVNSLHAQWNFSVSTDKTVYRYGDSVFVTVRATNTGDNVDTLFFGSCLQANYILDSINWAQAFAWCQITTSRIVLPHTSTAWGRSYFSGYAFPERPPLEAGNHSVLGQVGRYWTSDTLWIVVTPVTDVADPAMIPRDNILENNYPNPFNPSTTIRFSLPRSSDVTLRVQDILGREIAVLVNGRMESGVHEVRFDGTGLASGVYLYTMTAGSIVKTKKLVIVK